MLFRDDSPDPIQAQAGAFALGLCGEERLEDAAEMFLRNSRTVVFDLYDHPVSLRAGPDRYRALLAQGVSGVTSVANDMRIK